MSFSLSLRTFLFVVTHTHFGRQWCECTYMNAPVTFRKKKKNKFERAGHMLVFMMITLLFRFWKLRRMLLKRQRYMYLTTFFLLTLIVQIRLLCGFLRFVETYWSVGCIISFHFLFHLNRAVEIV